jgi:peptidoglycan/xylan/chitin deacetylase (PgdA/CDA1 family)
VLLFLFTTFKQKSMTFYWTKTNRLIKKIFSDYVWDIPNNEKKIYLTFDDGPTPEITEWTLNVLKQNKTKATFFCIGKNIEENPHLFKKIIVQGHTIGNHTQHHLNGWKTENKVYFENIKRTEELIETEEFKQKRSKLFRPPYGKITPNQAQKLQKQGYKIIMWDVLSADFDQNISKEKCLENCINNIESGSVIVFHDSVKAFPNLKYALPKTIEYCQKKGFMFDVIS